MREETVKEAFEVTPATTQWLDIFVLWDGGIMLSLKRGQDITELLEVALREYGVDCRQQFKSPCG